ncbi:MAG: hypothetical protein CL840_22420 [Crocinitomicaceae bacterium]|nr:hypothetical protein [Crocinitomicaceae bacterium]|tara:strand:- start:4306 stop:5544 length:1239 start_codon:yes stop_codon:yes gene_type:complete
MISTKSNFFLIAILFIFAGSGFQSCKKELEINADYRAYPIVYGLLNQYDSLQVIKVNKSFLGNDDPRNYAGVQDSSLFEQVDLKLIEYHNGIKQKSYVLNKMVLNNKEPGIFANPENVVYGTVLPKLKPNGIKYLNETVITEGQVSNRVSYKIEGTVNGDINISAEMNPIPEYRVDFFQQSEFRTKWNADIPKIGFASATKLTEGIVLQDVEIPPFTKIAELKFTFNYIDTDLNGDTTHHFIEATMGEVIVPVLSETKIYKTDFAIKSERFYQLIAALVPDFDATKLKQRMPGHVDFEIVLGDENYYYYRENTLPSDDLNQLKPQFSNIENGFGIFVSRMKVKMTDWAIGTQEDIISIKGMPGVLLNRTSQEALNRGYILQGNGEDPIQLGTASKGFCIDPEVGNVGSDLCK